MSGKYVVKVGCCGFPVSRKKYFKFFETIELQNTFYNLPSIEWAEKLRKEAPTSFIFNMKAWQVITHPSTSPTWKKLKQKPPGNLANYGFLKPTKENFTAWEKVLDIADTLKAKVIVLQTPASLPYTDESIRWVREFFNIVSSVTSNKHIIGWEPRGKWVTEKALNVLREILVENNITHIIDIFRRDPVHIYKILYIRLHGIGGKEVNYRYKYTDEDLEHLLNKIRTIGHNNAFVLFNNVAMFDDALRFKKILLRKA